VSSSWLVRQSTKCSTENFLKKLRGEKDIEATLQRLDRLTLDEVRATAAQTLEVVYSLVRHRRVVMDGEKFTCLILRSLLNVHMQMGMNR
jgi:hypothetical protein